MVIADQHYFAETEQVAFQPSNVGPGIDFSDDPLLQGRLFSYHDTQLHRLGSLNFAQLTISPSVSVPQQPARWTDADGSEDQSCQLLSELSGRRQTCRITVKRAPPTAPLPDQIGQNIDAIVALPMPNLPK